MSDQPSKSSGRYDVLGPHFAARERLLAGAVAAGAAYAVLWFQGIAGPLLVALAWDFGAVIYLLLTWVMMLRSTTEHIARRARLLDISLGEIVALTVLAAAFSLYAAAGVLGAAKAQADFSKALFLAVGVGTIILSWFFVHTLFAVHYAHEFHDEDREEVGKPRGGLDFPGEKQPDYWDFVYFAAVIAMTCQVSDVSVDSRAMRHLVTAHGIISFFLNTVIVALAVGIAASLI
ncbi:MAG: DUF1345 domain-containing protein [Rhodospirillaceae bacterium]|nr:DUF1345 domain-containing protein [Rhodospirillaceae bacterium]